MRFLLSLLSLVATASFSTAFRPCGTEPSPEFEALAARVATAGSTEQPETQATTEVNTYFHVVSSRNGNPTVRFLFSDCHERSVD